MALSSDDSTILSADKFGDVYAIPLVPSDAPWHYRNPRQAQLSTPAATNLTVHTKRNLQSLQQQHRQQANKEAQQKSAPDFEHQILLGHVSMLTDVAFVSFPVESGMRNYILTADRDEHIRVSRGPPQAHIIEGFCLGHTAFVNKLCVPRWAPEYLVSGGGDSYLLVWKWAEGRILQKVSLVDQLSDDEVAVRGIWAVSLEADGASGPLNIIFVALEGYI